MSVSVVNLDLSDSCSQQLPTLFNIFKQEVAPQSPHLDILVWRGKTGGQVSWKLTDDRWDMTWEPVPDENPESAQFHAVFDSFV